MCGGGKGQSQQTTQQQQTYTPSPYVAGAGQAAISGAEYAAGQPFQMPVAPLAPFTPYQLAGQQATAGALGMAQPYFGAGSGYLMGSAAPVTGQDVAGYYNPMASNVMAGLQDVFGQQMRETTGRAVQQAGGTGADRIAVAQANLAKQQGLAAGQTMAGLYYPALQAAEQQKQMMAGAGYGLAQMGPAAQAAQLQSIQALMGAGGQQQQMSQAYLNALYQNRLAQLGYPFQTAQYLAGIAGGLAPALGGTTGSVGSATYTPAQPSPLAQGFGIGTSLLGLGGEFGMFGGYNPGTIGGTGGGLGGLYKRGGKIIDLDKSQYSRMSNGGLPAMPRAEGAVYNPQPIGMSGTVDPSVAMTTQQAESQAAPFMSWYGAGAPGMPTSPYAMGTSGIPAWAEQQIGRLIARPQPQMQMPQISPRDWRSIKGGHLGNLVNDATLGLFDSGSSQQQPLDLAAMGVARGGIADSEDDTSTDDSSDEGGADIVTGAGGTSVVPHISLPMGAGHSGLFPGQQIAPMQAPRQSSSGKGGGIGQAIGMAADVLPFFLAEGGAVTVDKMGQGFQEGGTTDDDDDGDGDDDDDDKYQEGGTIPDVMPGTDPYGVGDPLLYGDYPGQPHLGMPDIQAAAAARSPEHTSPFDVQRYVNLDLPHRMPSLFGTDQAGAVPAAYVPQFKAPEQTALMPGARPISAPTRPGDPLGETLDKAAPVTKRQESGDYSHVETSLDKQGRPQRALGAYGIMESNLPQWSKEVFGKPMTTEEFLNNPAAQDAIYRNKMGGYIQKYGVEGAGRAWLGGEGNVNNPNVADPYGTRVGDYGRRFAQGVAGGVAPPPTAVAGGPGMDPSRYMMPRSMMPFPGTTADTFARRATSSPWMALIKAGGAMASTPGPIGTVIGAGIKAGAGELEAQRKRLDSEEAINQKAAGLYEHAMAQLDRYNMMTPYQQRRLELSAGRYAEAQDKAYGDARAKAIKELSIKYPAGNIPEDEIEATVHKYLPHHGSENAGSIQQSGSATDPIKVIPSKDQLKQGLYYITPQGPKMWDGSKFTTPATS